MTSTETPSDFVHPAIEALLVAVARAADDLRLFHDTVIKATIDQSPPFPRTAVATTSRVIEHLKEVDEDLRKVLIALGLPETPPDRATTRPAP
ncbi:MAG TPA: hypothetical protein VGZ27_10515 [Vicinamibacterales bacterium]|jgi:hypothetical protein|nr:hypothetical protein [Vicinamibacterales bacterium]